MKCEQFGVNLEAFLSDELDERTAKDMREHVETCADCKLLMESTADLANTLKARGLCTMTLSMERKIRNKVNERIAGKSRMTGFSVPKWALVGAAVAIVILLGLFTMRQQSVNAASAVIARAEAKLDGVTSYYVKYKDTQVTGSRVSYNEQWQQSPDKLKVIMQDISRGSEPGGSRHYMVWIMKGSSQWVYVTGSDALYLSPLSATARQRAATRFRTPRDMLKNLDSGHRYVGAGKVGGRECDVIEGAFGHFHVRTSIDRETGFLLQSVTTENGKLIARQDIVDLQVNKPIPDEIFKPKMTTGALLVSVPSTPGMEGIPALPLLSADGLASQLSEPNEAIAKLIRLGEDGVKYGARLKKLYAPTYVPEGHKLAMVAQVPDLFQGGARLARGVYSTIYVEYIDPKTGGTIVLTESSEKPLTSEGTRVSSNGFEGRILTHQVLFPATDLLWEADGIYFTLSASYLDEKAAVALAQSMKLVFPQPDGGPGVYSAAPSVGSSRERANESKSTNNLKQLGVATLMYVSDHDGKLPTMHDSAQVKTAIWPYLHQSPFYLNPITGKPYLMNTTLSGQILKEVRNPSETVLFYEDAPAKDGTRGVCLLDMHARRLSGDSWSRLKQTSKIQ